MTRELRPKSTRLYLATEGLPVAIPDPGTRLTYHATTWWTVRAARTLIDGHPVYVELEQRDDGCASTVRHPRALAIARLCERLARGDDHITIRAGEVV